MGVHLQSAVSPVTVVHTRALHRVACWGIGVSLFLLLFSSLARASQPGVDCGCSLTGPYQDPAASIAPRVNADGTSPHGTYQLTVTGSNPIYLTINRVATNEPILSLNVPGNSFWGFSPDDHRFI